MKMGLLVSMSALILSGCGASGGGVRYFYYNSTATSQKANIELSICRMQAQRRIQMEKAGKSDPYANVRSSDVWAIALSETIASIGQGYTMNSYIDNCMMSRGYQKITGQQLQSIMQRQ